MRDLLITNEEYFTNFLNRKKELLADTKSRIETGEITDDNLPDAKHRFFVSHLEILISNFSKGEPIDSIKTEYTSVLNFMKTGWEDSVVKFKKGKAPNHVVLNKYFLMPYNYMIWMLSLAILLDVTQNEKEILATIIEDGKIDDELIQLLLSFLIGKEFSDSSKTTYKPFSGIVKSGQLIDNPKSMKNYLEKWYANTKLLMWHNYKSSIETTQYYYGYWSFESAAVTCILELDDSSYRDNQYYPKDLVDYYRENHPA